MWVEWTFRYSGQGSECKTPADHLLYEAYACVGRYLAAVTGWTSVSGFNMYTDIEKFQKVEVRLGPEHQEEYTWAIWT